MFSNKKDKYANKEEFQELKREFHELKEDVKTVSDDILIVKSGIQLITKIILGLCVVIPVVTTLAEEFKDSLVHPAVPQQIIEGKDGNFYQVPASPNFHHK